MMNVTPATSQSVLSQAMSGRAWLGQPMPITSSVKSVRRNQRWRRWVSISDRGWKSSAGGVCRSRWARRRLPARCGEESAS